MQLSYLFAPVTDLEAAAAFYRDVLGWEEAWREGETTIAFAAPEGDAQVMLDTTEWPAGPMYLVPDLAAWLARQPDPRGARAARAHAQREHGTAPA